METYVNGKRLNPNVEQTVNNGDIIFPWKIENASSLENILNTERVTMAYTVILHILGDLPVLGEVDELPKPTDTNVIVANPRQRDGKDLHYLEANVVKVIFPLGSGQPD